MEKRLCGSSFGVASFTKDLDIDLPEQYLHIRYNKQCSKCPELISIDFLISIIDLPTSTDKLVNNSNED
jgi:hypothetical protein